MKIPQQAKRVFRGVIFDIYQWEQEMFDGSKQTFEMAKRPDTVVVIGTADGKIIMAEQEQPNHGKFWSLLGGRCEDGEEPLAAAKRELLEEGGFVSQAWQLWRTYRPSSKLEWNVYYYIARDCTKVAEPTLDAGEKITILPLSFEKFVDIACSTNFGDRELVIDLLNMKLNPPALAEFESLLLQGK